MTTAARPNFPPYWTVRERPGVANAGSYSCGGFVWFMSPGVVTGIIFYTAKVGAHTIRVSLFNPAGTRVATTDVACSGPGTYTGTFATPYQVTEADVQSQTDAWNGAFAIQMWETSGAHHTQTFRGGLYYDDKGMWAFHPRVNNFRQAGDVWIGTSNTTNVYAAIDVVGYGIGEVPDDTPPAITPIDPVDGDVGVDKDTTITFRAIDTESGINLSTVKAWVRGELVFSEGRFDRYWSGSSYQAITDGYEFSLVPSRLKHYGRSERIGVRAYAEDIAENQTNVSWSFVSRLVVPRIYGMLFEGIRKFDEE